MTSILIHDVNNIKIQRKEQETQGMKYIIVDIVAKDLTGKEYIITMFSESKYTWTDATKELAFTEMSPNTIFIENEKEKPIF